MPKQLSLKKKTNNLKWHVIAYRAYIPIMLLVDTTDKLIISAAHHTSTKPEPQWINTQWMLPLHHYTSDSCVIRKGAHFMSWQFFKLWERKKSAEKGEKCRTVLKSPHIHTLLIHSGSRRWMTSCEVLYPSGQPTHCKFWPPQYTSAPEPWKEGEN